MIFTVYCVTLAFTAVTVLTLLPTKGQGAILMFSTFFFNLVNFVVAPHTDIFISAIHFFSALSAAQDFTMANLKST